MLQRAEILLLEREDIPPETCCEVPKPDPSPNYDPSPNLTPSLNPRASPKLPSVLTLTRIGALVIALTLVGTPMQTP